VFVQTGLMFMKTAKAYQIETSIRCSTICWLFREWSTSGRLRPCKQIFEWPARFRFL